ncbi:MAG: undecaprenyl-diphosphate phosphatase [Candidatus Neomarinimicrobiota bacterium]
MTPVEAAILGILQGVTEFLPISSSGHLVVAEELMRVQSPGILFEVVVHLGTLISILIVFKEEIGKLLRNWSTGESKAMFGYLIIGTIPVVISGSIFKSQLESAFEDLRLVSFAFLLTGFVLILTAFVSSRTAQLDKGKSTVIGLSQAFALIPGISRSGMTISTGLFLGINPEESARFSFLLAVPSLFGSGVIMTRDFLTFGAGKESPLVLAVGFVTSVLIGVVALRFLLHILVRGRFHWFGIYCLIAGISSMWI